MGDGEAPLCGCKMGEMPMLIVGRRPPSLADVELGVGLSPLVECWLGCGLGTVVSFDPVLENDPVEMVCDDSGTMELREGRRPPLSAFDALEADGDEELRCEGKGEDRPIMPPIPPSLDCDGVEEGWAGIDTETVLL